MTNLVTRQLVWWALVVFVLVALDDKTCWVVGGLLLSASLGGFAASVVEHRAERQAARARAQTRQARETSDQPSESSPWKLSLLVDGDDQAGVMRPVLQVGGPQLPAEIVAHLTVIDGGGAVRLTTERRFRHSRTGADLVLGTLAIPDRVCAQEVARWDWEVVLRWRGRELGRRRGPLVAASRLNAEAELEPPDLRMLAYLTNTPRCRVAGAGNEIDGGRR